MSGMLDLTTARPIVEGLNWMITLGSSEIKNVKVEMRELLGHLSKSLLSLWDVTQQVSSLSDEHFANGFESVYTYFKRFYYDPENLERARTHCTDVSRDVDRITFKLSMLFRTNLGKWSDAEECLRLCLLGDASYIEEYNKNFETLNRELSTVHALVREGKEEEAEQAYRGLRQRLCDDMDHLNAYIKRLREADDHIRRIVG